MTRRQGKVPYEMNTEAFLGRQMSTPAAHFQKKKKKQTESLYFILVFIRIRPRSWPSSVWHQQEAKRNARNGRMSLPRDRKDKHISPAHKRMQIFSPAGTFQFYICLHWEGQTSKLLHYDMIDS